ncbi:MAG TPA: carbohydrate ABC transporter permease, partial [Anaerolineales bacterium]|nr:carbohydrate ABC transporter permease [Anaerolineales bacterium]
LPAAAPAFIVSIIFSIVWYWNETYLTVVFLEGGVQTLPMQLSKFVQAYENLYPPGVVNVLDRLNEAVKLAGTFLNILPLLAMYFVLQRWFVESVERSGITGE